MASITKNIIGRILPKKDKSSVEPEKTQDSNIEEHSLINSEETGDKDKIIWLNPNDIHVDPEISNLFEIKPENLESIKASILERKYDISEPIVGWINDEEKYIVADGHSRRIAAIDVGLTEVPFCVKNFMTKKDAINYCLRRQGERRQLSEWDVCRAAGLMLNKNSRDGTGRAAEALAKLLRINSPSKITHGRMVYNIASEEDKEKIKNGEATINSIYQKIKKSKQKETVEIENAVDELRNENIQESSESKQTIEVVDNNENEVKVKKIKREVKNVKNEKIESEQKKKTDSCKTVNVEDILILLHENNEHNAIKTVLTKYKEAFDEDFLVKIKQKPSLLS